MHRDGNRQMGLAGARTADKDEIAKLGDELPFIERAQLCLINPGFAKLEAPKVTLQGEVSLTHAVTDGTGAALSRFGFEQGLEHSFSRLTALSRLGQHLVIDHRHAAQAQLLHQLQHLSVRHR